MTKEKIELLLASDATRFCKSCGLDLPVSMFFIKHDKRHENSYRFNSPCKPCGYLRRNTNYQKEYQRRRKFGISTNDYNNMLVKQSGKCAICGIEDSDYTQDFAIDHCHTTGKIRGLLCRNCNTGLGFFKDDIKALKKAIKYLTQNS